MPSPSSSSSPRRTNKRIKRIPFSTTDNNYLIGIGFGILALAVFGAIYLAVDAVMGGSKLYLYHKEGEDDSLSLLPVIEHLVGSTSQEKERALHPDFLYEQSSAAEGYYTPPPRVVEFYAPWCPHCQHYAPRYKKLAQDVTSLQPSIKFYAVSCVAHKELCRDQGIHGYPTIKLYKAGSYDFRKGNGVKNDVTTVLQELGFVNDGNNNIMDAADNGSNETKEDRHAKQLRTIHDKKKHDSGSKEIARIIPFHDHDVHDAWYDASLSFEFALQHAIYIENGSLAPEKSMAFQEWLELLSKSLPTQMSRTHDIITGILNNYSKATKGQSELDALVRDYIKSEPNWTWRTCTYGDNKMGYTCGLWQLFHIMSVGVVEYNEHNHISEYIPTRHASETLRNYIDNFFQCDVCRMNFLSMYDSCAFDGCHRLSDVPSDSVREWRELPLWLWETHNDVNVRLLGERLEQNKEEKPNQWESQQARWPALFACPNCWREEETPSEDEIYKHLHSMYWSGNPSYLKIDGSMAAADALDGGGGSRIPLRWKITVIIFSVAAILWRLHTSKKVRRNSGKHKK